MSNPIGWCDRTLNPAIYRCQEVSPACAHCYAAIMAHRQVAMGNYPPGITVKRASGVHWSGVVKVDADRIKRVFAKLPDLGRGRRVFVTSMADLFHRDVPFDFIERVFVEMVKRPSWTFMVLTKRPERAVEWWHHRVVGPSAWATAGYTAITGTRVEPLWPANVWMGTTVEDQERANERIPHLLQIPAKVRFLSCEPLLGPIQLGIQRCSSCGGTGTISGDPPQDCQECDGRGRWTMHPDGVHSLPATIDWVIAGGESGSKSRPTNPAWFYSLRDQCVDAGVSFWFKQWGMWAPGEEIEANGTDWTGMYEQDGDDGGATRAAWDRDGNRVDYWTSTGNIIVHDVLWAGTKLTGRLLDGREWLEVPRGA